MQTTSMTCYSRVVDGLTTYLRAVAVEAIDREQRRCLSIDDNFKYRRETSGILPRLGLCAVEIDLPDEVFYHPAVVDMVECAADLITVDNVKSHKRLGFRYPNGLHRICSRTIKNKRAGSTTIH